MTQPHGFQQASETMAGMSQQAAGNFEATIERIREINESLIESAKANGNVALDTYETALRSMLDFQRSMANSAQVDWINTIAHTQVQFIQDISDAYIKAAREMLK